MFWTRLGICSSIASFSFPFSSFLFCFSFLLMVFPFWLSISLTSNSFLSFFLIMVFYINHAIVTPLHPFGLLVSKKDYIYPCSRYANNSYTLVAHCFLFSFSSLSLFFSISYLLLSSPLYPFSSYLDYRFPSLLCSSRLSFLTILLFFSSFISSFLFFTDTNRL